MLEKLFDMLLERIQGLGFAVTILTTLLGLAAVREQSLKEVLITAVTWSVTIALFFVGRWWDCLWDKLFGPKRRWESVLKNERSAASETFRSLGWETNELQAASTSLFKHSSKWEERIRYPLEFSKAARTFIGPLIFLLIYELVGWPLGEITPAFRRSLLASPIVTGLLLLSASAFYVWLRIKHNQRLYRLVVEAQPLCIDRQEQALLTDFVTNANEQNVEYHFSCSRFAVNPQATATEHR